MPQAPQALPVGPRQSDTQEDTQAGRAQSFLYKSALFGFIIGHFKIFKQTARLLGQLRK
jgi:hypothetical protein